jgi:hypothetical protein
MKNADLEKLATDDRLNSDAVRIVIFVERQGAGMNPIAFGEFSEILNHAGRRKVRTALQLAEKHGWISREKGGYGSPDRYQFIEQHRGAESGTVNSDLGGVASEPLVEEVGGQMRPPLSARGAKSDPSTCAREIRKRERVVDVVVVEEGPFELDERVEEELRKDQWNGFRNSLKDYFTDRVPTEKQWGYLMTVRTWFDGGPTGPKGFHKLTPAKQALLMAGAVNELLAQSMREEKLTYKSSQGLAGNTSTLRSKIEYHLRRGGAWDAGKDGDQTSLSIGGEAWEFPEDREPEG